MNRFLRLTAVLLSFATQVGAATIATFTIPEIGSFDVEFFDDKPVTVSNFLKYATSGRFENQIIHRWVPGFVIQGGGYRVNMDDPQAYQLEEVPSFGAITNETRVGTFRSNTFGTIAMARLGSETNSATSEWFINLADDNASSLDNA